MNKKLPEGWEVKKLGEVCAFLSRGISPKYIDQGGVCVLNQKCIRDHIVSYDQARRHDLKIKAVSSERFIQLGDVLVNSTGTGTLGRVAQVRNIPIEPTTVDSHVSIVRPKPGKFFLDFFGYTLVFIEELIKQAGEGCGGQTELARLVLANKFLVSYPTSLPEQKNIVSILDEAFAAIASAKENAEKNLKNARELFDSYLNNIFTNPGEGWEVKKLGEVCKIKPTKNEARARLSDNDLVSFVPMEDLGILTKSFTVTKERLLKEVLGSYTYFANDDVLLAKITPCFENGKIGIARDLKNGVGFGSSEYIVFRSNGTLISDYLYYYLVRDEFRAEGANVMTGAVGHKRVPKEFVENLKIPYPTSLIEQKRIVSILDEAFLKTKRLESIYQQKITALDELKKSILEKAFSGELKKKTFQKSFSEELKEALL